MNEEMGRVIPLFKTDRSDPPPGEDEEVDDLLHEVLNEELAASLVDVQSRIDDLFRCNTLREFREDMRAIKADVARWPDA